MNREKIKNDIINILSKKELYYFKMVDKYYLSCDKNNITKMINIINGDSKISLRILDWFVTRYASKYKTSFGNINDNLFNVHISYKAQLKSYKKRYFDPFRRRKKFIYNYDKSDQTKILSTTLGQLNFFRWALTNGIIDYVDNHYDEISNCMITSNKEDKKKKKQKNNVQAVLKITPKVNNNYEYKIILKFD